MNDDNVLESSLISQACGADSNFEIEQVCIWVAEMERELKNDVRWQLIERIGASNSFQKSTRLRDLLYFIADRTLHDDTQSLGEHQIGTAVFGKPEDYSAVEDSSVRVQVRQLRLRLHEYFNGEGRDETCIFEIPKGSYTGVFHTPLQLPDAPQERVTRSYVGVSWFRLLPWALAGIFLATTLVVWFHYPTPTASANPPWPLSELFDQANGPVQVVVADANYGILLLFSKQPVTLSQYLSPSFWNAATYSTAQASSRESRIAEYIAGSTLTSFADAVVSNSLTRLSGALSDRVTINSARNLHPRDLEKGNFIFIGGPRSNPWVSSFQDKLNFQESMGPTDLHVDCFHNLHPRPWEQEMYCPIHSVGSPPVFYATISLLPLPGGHGKIMILQGLQEQGTEATALFLADADNRQELQQALGMAGTSKQPVYFEALLLTRSIANAPTATSSIVATRVIKP